MDKIAIIGAGFIGRAWAIVFARAGFAVQVWDPVVAATGAARGFIAERLPELHQLGLLADPPEQVLARISPMATLEAALDGVLHAQESGPEVVETKQALFARMDAIAAPGTVLASSTSGIPASAFTEGLKGAARCLVAHPVNPPYLVPVVELCPSPWTGDAVLAQSRALMQRAGMVPATVKREIAGFVLNRLQIALVSEAFRLVADNVISVEDLDATVKHGLGLRWSFMGPFETIDLNAPGGVADYVKRYGALYEQVQNEQNTIVLTDEIVQDIEAARRKQLPEARLPVRGAWRDRRLMALLAHKKAKPDS
jgi:3-hydroxyacyl-CoA dehydrogenase